ncbi:DNA polymerase delta subunit 4 [Ananas comosus]|uniref:DNA polymerase delta subunit 4 n=1 Tax=Ananas comosus TaxID=4615 RepID=A0A199W034_ANACO|nr:DNA polymerase delta subunit 4 [Ananas comosus]
MGRQAHGRTVRRSSRSGSDPGPHRARILGSRRLLARSLVRSDDYGEEEERLRQFDMDMRYGPCIGLGRLQRWERAAAMGLNPPPDVARILQRPSAALECLWDGRV